jgi:hypothetical protein
MNVTKFIVFIIIILFILYMFYLIHILQKLSNNGDKPFKKVKLTKNDELYNNIVGNQIDNVVIELTNNLSERERNIHENILLGNIWNRVLNDRTVANNYYTVAYEDFNNNPVNDDINDNDFLILIDFFQDNIINENIRRNVLINDESQFKEMVTKAENKEEATTEYFNEKRIVNSDSQNVHDTNIGDSMCDEYKKIKEIVKNNKASKTYLTCKNEIKSKLQENVYNDYFKIVDYNNKFSKFNENEGLIFSNLWSYVTIESSNKKELISAFIDAINNSFESNNLTNGLVCINGRIGRLMGSFAFIDKNGFGVYKSIPIIRNDCFDLANKIYKENIDNIKENKPDLYKDYIDDIDNNDVNNFKDRLSNLIKEEITNKYTKEVDKVQLDLIIQEALIAI